jgi:hypothetical protein
VTLAVIVAPAHPLVLTVSHDLPVANPFNCGGLTPPCSTVLFFRASDAAISASSPPQTEGRNAAPSAAMSGSVSRSSNPLPAAHCGVAHLFLTGMSASLADQHHTDEAFCPDLATHLPGHPASFVR